MDISQYKTRIGKSRHKEVEVLCSTCGELFWAKEYKLSQGKNVFCSRGCSARSVVSQYIGKENACVHLNKTAGRYDVYWFEPGGSKRSTSTYAKWWYEMNVGEIPAGYLAGYRDGNPLNINDDNIYIQSPAEFGSKISQRLMGHSMSDETKKKIGDKHRGTTLTDEHKQKIGQQTKRMWKDGVFDDPEIREAYSKQGKATKGSIRSDETKKKMSNSHLGKVNLNAFTPEAIAKRVAKITGRKQSSEANLKRSQTMKGREFSEEHLANLKKTARRGEDSNFWNGGITDRQYPDEFDAQLKKKVRVRDNQMCQVCGVNVYRSVKGHIHHIDGDKQNTDMDNLILLCISCHRKVHNLEVQQGWDVVDALEKVMNDYLVEHGLG